MTGFDHPLFLIPVVTGSIFMLAGLIMLTFPPKRINDLYGYRTANSMHSKDRWDFAQRYSAKQMVLSGIFLILASALSFVYSPKDAIGTAIALGIVVLAAIFVIARTESAIRSRFNNN